MANRYPVISGNWSNTAVWSATSGGAGGASVPVYGDSVYPNAASGAITLTLNGYCYCTDFDCLGFTGTLAGPAEGVGLYVIGEVFRLSAAMTVTYEGYVYLTNTDGMTKITTAGKVLAQFCMPTTSTCIFQLQDPLAISKYLVRYHGTFDPNGQKVTLTGTGCTIIGLSGDSALYDLDVIPTTPVSGQYLSLGSDLAVANALTFNGGPTYDLELKSFHPGTSYTVTVNGTVSGQYVTATEIVWAGTATRTALLLTYANDDTWNVIEQHLLRALQQDTQLAAGGALEVSTWEQELPEDVGVYQANLLPAVAVEIQQQSPEQEVGFPDYGDQIFQAVVFITIAGGELSQVKAAVKRYLARVVRVLHQQHHPTKQLAYLPAALAGADTGSVRARMVSAAAGGGRLEGGSGLRGIAEINVEIAVGITIPTD